MDKKPTLKRLSRLYITKQKSAKEIADLFGCSEHGINYWLKKYNIKKRSLSDAIYAKHNPDGDPFKIRKNLSVKDLKLNSLGLGIYWGEGDKSPNNKSVRLGNTDPFLIKKFREFLRKIYLVKEKKIKYGLILFNDSKESTAVNFWKKYLGI